MKETPKESSKPSYIEDLKATLGGYWCLDHMILLKNMPPGRFHLAKYGDVAL